MCMCIENSSKRSFQPPGCCWEVSQITRDALEIRVSPGPGGLRAAQCSLFHDMVRGGGRTWTWRPRWNPCSPHCPHLSSEAARTYHCVGATVLNICLNSSQLESYWLVYVIYCFVIIPLNRAVHKNNHRVCSWTCSLAGTAYLPTHSVTLGHLELGVTCWLGAGTLWRLTHVAGIWHCLRLRC